MCVNYQEDSIKTVDWREHIRMCPCLYIGKLGDGSSPDDGIYVLIKEILDNSLDEHTMGYGKQIEIDIDESGKISVRDYGRGIPLSKVLDVTSKMNTSAKYDSDAFKKAIGGSGTGIKIVNALSNHFYVQSFRGGRTKAVSFTKGQVLEDKPESATDQPAGTLISFIPDETLLGDYQIIPEYVERLLKNYTFTNCSLTITYNGASYEAHNGLLDLLDENMYNGLYDPIHLKNDNIEIAICHGYAYSEEYYSFVNGQFTPQGGTHQQAFREAYAQAICKFYQKKIDVGDICSSIIAAISIKIEKPIFESQTKTKLGSKNIAPGSDLSIYKFIGNFIKRELTNYLNQHPETANAILEKIMEGQEERDAMAAIKRENKKRKRK